jgi:hypothetical protein
LPFSKAKRRDISSMTESYFETSLRRQHHSFSVLE